jgi:hypothetical protein
MWIIGDIHGRLHTLKALIKKLPENAKIICTGDLIDRGLWSQEVIRFVRDAENITSVLGNHDDFIVSNHTNGHLINGGQWFYKLSKEEQEELRDYLQSLPLTKLIIAGDKEAVVSHAPMCSIARRDILWNICDGVNLVPEFNIFGHVIQEHGPYITEDRVGIDTGLTCLSAVHWPSLEVVSEDSHQEDFSPDWWNYIEQYRTQLNATQIA